MGRRSVEYGDSGSGVGVTARVAREDLTHWVEDTGFRQRAYLAICGAWVHAKEMKTRASGEPTCPKCKRMVDKFDAEEVAL